MEAAGGWGKMERRPWGIDSHAHLGSGQHVEVDLWAATDWRWVIVGGGALVLRQGREVTGVVRDEAGNDAGLLIAGVRRFGGEIFVLTGAPTGSWWPAGIPVVGRHDDSCGDGTARATMGCLGQRLWRGRGELGVLGWWWH
jgi:hypothetical protein